jgi:segregation and condensation protein B
MNDLNFIEDSGPDDTLTKDPSPLSQADDYTFEQKVAAVQTLLLVSGSSLELKKIEEACGFTSEDIQAAIDRLIDLCAQPECGFEIVTFNNRSKFQLRTKSEYAHFVHTLKAEKPKRLTQPALETLAIIAYKQPIVKSEIEKIRGVDTTPTLKTLLDRNLVKILGYQDTVGHPALYATTDNFLEIFSLDTLKSLPPLHEIGQIELDPGEGEAKAANDE